MHITRCTCSLSVYSNNEPAQLGAVTLTASSNTDTFISDTTSVILDRFMSESDLLPTHSQSATDSGTCSTPPPNLSRWTR